MRPGREPSGLREEQASPRASADDDDLDEMTNIDPRRSGPPMRVWISPRGRARPDVRAKVCRAPGDRMIPEDTAVVPVRPRPMLLEGEPDAESLRAVQAWIALNRDVLIDFWNGELAQRLRRV